MSFSQGFNNVLPRAREGFIGEWMQDSVLKEYGTLLNDAPQRVQVSTVTVDSDPGDNVDGTVTVNGITVSFNTGTGNAEAGIATAIANALNAEPLVRGQVLASAAAAVVTLTALLPGIPFTLVEAEAYLTATTPTISQTADAVPFGRAVVSQGYATGEGEGLGTLASTSAFAQQVQTLTVTESANAPGTAAVYRILGPGERELITRVDFAPSAVEATYAGNARTALNAALPANTVDITGTGATLIATAEVAGLEFDVELLAVATVVATTGPNRDTSLARAFGGVSLRSGAVEAPFKGALEGEYAPNQSFLHARRGSVWVESSDGVAQGQDVYVDLTPGATAGRLYNAAGTGRLKLSRNLAEWVRPSRVAANEIAAVDIKRGA
ncbi:MAG: hypothetical protein AAGA48_27635 [Myxococcota bacterium]